MQVQLASDTQKTATLIRITAVAWFFGKIMSWKLWLSNRLFPLAAPIDFFPEFSNSVHFFLLLFSLVGLILVLFFPKNIFLILAVFILETASCTLDQLRWQPWEYQYLLTFFFFLVYRKNLRDFINAILFLLLATYIFSGLNKFNGGFLFNVWDNLVLQKLFGISENIIMHPILHYAGVLLPMTEIIIGIGLYFSKNKKAFVVMSLLMHLFLLIALGPTGLDRNSVVWPWNVAMMLLVFTIFYNTKQAFIPLAYLIKRRHLPVVLFVFILPVFHFFGLWPAYLSFSMYSGNPKNLVICLRDAENNSDLVPFISNKNSPYCQGQQTINAPKWAFTELNVPIYAEESYYEKLKMAWEKKFPETESRFVIFYYPFKPENAKEIK